MLLKNHNMRYICLFILLLSNVIFLPCTHQLQTSQSRALLQLRKHLEYPSALEILKNYVGDFCNLSSSAHISISCQGNSVTELKIMGDKVLKFKKFNGYAIPNQTLSERFSIDSFVTTLTRLPSLKVLSLVSLGIWGEIPDKIHRLSSLELLDLSSNLLFGYVPPKISRMVKLHTLVLGGNYFNGTVPDWFDSLSNLSILCMKNNKFTGQFPNSIFGIKTLTDFSMSHNKVSGKLPDLSTLSSLHLLDLRENHFDSELPLMPKGLVTALLSRNSFSGKIPGHFGELGQLQHLDLSFNDLSGIPPSNIFSLPNISYLNLAFNRLSGTLPVQLRCGGKLGFVDISVNRLTGGLPYCLDSSSNKRFVKFDGNCLSIDSMHQYHESYCKEAMEKEKESRGIELVVLIAGITGAVIVIVLLAFGVLFFRRRFYARKTFKQHILPKVVQDNSLPGVCSELIVNASKFSVATFLFWLFVLVNFNFCFRTYKSA